MDWALFIIAGALTAGALALALVRGTAQPLSIFTESNEWHRQLVTWEYERLAGSAKTLVLAATGFLGALLTAVLKDELGDHVTTTHVVGCALGIVGTFAIAARIELDARDFARFHQGATLTW